MTTELTNIINALNEAENPEKPMREQDARFMKRDERDKELYILWASLPSIVRKLKDTDLLSMGYPIEDPMFKKVIESHSQNQFCLAFGINKNRPAIWRKRDPEIETRIADLAHKTNVLRFEKDINFAFSQKTLRNADAPRVKLYHQLFKGWTEKSGVEHSGKVTTLHQLIRELETDDE